MELAAQDALLRLAGIAAQRDLRAFLRLTWPRFQQGTPYVQTWAGDAMCEHLQAFYLGQIELLGVEVPPGSGKSSRASVAGPVWAWQQDPSLRLMCGSYDLIFASRLNRRRRRLALDKAVRAVTRPGYEMVRGERAATFFQNSAGGWMAAVSPDGGVTTGEHCTHMVLDDLAKPDAGPKRFKELAEWFTGTLLSRFKDQNRPRIAMVAQRLGKGDPTDVFYEAFPDAEVLRIPAEYDPRRSRVTCLGWRDPRRVEGESFFPERYDPDHLRKKRRQMGTAAFEAQYNQNPQAGAGGIFKREWFRHWEHRPDLSRAVWASFTDCTFRGGAGADHVVIQVWAAVDGHAYLMDQARGQLDFPQTCAALAEMAKRWPQCGRWMVEAGRAANGDALVDTMKRLVPGVLGVSYERGQTKDVRAQAFAPMAEAGQILIPARSLAPWVDGWLDELAGFTGQDGQPDDQVDAASGALNYLRGHLLEGLGDVTAAEIVRPVAPPRPRRGW